MISDYLCARFCNLPPLLPYIPYELPATANRGHAMAMASDLHCHSASLHVRGRDSGGRVRVVAALRRNW